MQSYINKTKLDADVIEFRRREEVITSLKKRFSTYGYKQIQTPSFEAYDLYSKVRGTISQDEMIKVVDRTGQVLVLRPDITIPITQQVAKQYQSLKEELRYFYVLDVFRHSRDQVADYAQTQAGVEFFGNNTPGADAEVIALSVHILNDLNVNNFTLEIGHAGFFKEVLGLLNLTEEETNQFKQLIQAKNIPGLIRFLNELNIDPSLQHTIKEIPLLYGSPLEVIERAKKFTLTQNMQAKVQTLEEIYKILTAYQVENNIVFDLGLINHMEYYSDVVFQGYIEHTGKPVLSGGRYDRLADQFGASIPAIGFAFDTDMLASNQQNTESEVLDFFMFYDPSKYKEAIQITQLLRNSWFTVELSPITGENNVSMGPKGLIKLLDEKNTLQIDGRTYPFLDGKELLLLLQDVQGGY